jgi:hypothetical protein
MKKKRLILISFGVLLLIPTVAFADCLDLGGSTSWVLEDTHTIVFYMGMRPMARLEIPDCSIYPSSNIRLIKSYVCDTDDIMIDKEKCSIMTVKVLD